MGKELFSPFTLHSWEMGNVIDSDQIARQHFTDYIRLESPFDIDDALVKAAVINLDRGTLL